jgi:hypothetical protein
MPRQYDMSYEGAPKYRWVKMHNGVRYRVTCEELGAMIHTKEATGTLANAWWRRKLAELEAPKERMMTEAEAIAAELAKTEVTIALHKTEQELIDMATATPSLLTPELTARLSAEIASAQQAVADTLELVAVPEYTWDVQVGRFMDLQLARGKAPGTFGDLSYYVGRLRRDCPPLALNDVRHITENTVTRVYSWLRNESGQSNIVQRKLFNYFRRFVRFLWGEALINLPRNLDEKIFSFDVTAKKIKRYPIQQVRALLAGLPDRLLLYALLALNAGMLGVDMALMRHEELQKGRVRRKRTKTRKGENVPEVEHVLWPETLALLDKYPRTHPEYVLTSKTGTPLWRAEIRDGKKVKVDLVSLQWHRGRGEGRATKPAIPLKALRSVSATIIEAHEAYGRFTDHFLGHSPRTIKDRHYAAPPQELFDKIVMWLRGQVLGADGEMERSQGA